MADEPLNHTLGLLRRMDAKLDRIIDDVGELKVRVTGLEENYAVVSRRLDRIEGRLDRIEKRLDLVEA
jgi:predicted  nucleic acid-binding Zn-ribbon protein